MISDESIEGEDTCKVGMLSVLTAVWIFGSVATPVTEDGALEIVSKLWSITLRKLQRNFINKVLIVFSDSVEMWWSDHSYFYVIHLISKPQ